MKTRAWVLALLLAPLVAPAAQGCLVPCGRIYPTILLSAGEDAPKSWPIAQGQTLDVELTLTYRFDAVNDGYTVATPNEPVFVTFEFPRKPQWVDMEVEPEQIPVDVNNPTYVTPPADPNAPQAWYSYSAKLTVHVKLTGQPVLRDGFDYAKLLVFAKSSESGLYQAGYGIKEIRIVPEGAVHESDVAGQRDVFAASPLPALDLAVAESNVLGTKVTVTPPEGATFWEPGTWTVGMEPAPAGASVFLALHDEAGNLVAMRGPTDAAGMTLNATIAKPGLHTMTATVLPPAGTSVAPLTYAVDVPVGVEGAEGHAYPKTYVVADRQPVPLPTGGTTDPTMQWERDVPFFAFDSAQAVSAVVTLVTPGLDALGRGLVNVQFSILDPDGNMLGTSSVDPSKPQYPLRVGSVPSEGWYTLRLRGVGAPTLAWYDARIEVDYTAQPQARNRADGAADATGPVLARAGRNLTLPLEGLGVWTPSDITPALDEADDVQYSVTVFDANGSLAYASGLRSGKASFTPPAPGTFRAVVFAQPTTGDPFPPVVRAFTFGVGDGRATTVSTFPIDDAASAPTAATASLLALYAVPVPAAGATLDGAATGGRVELVDAQGQPADGSAPGTYFLRAYSEPGPAKDVPVKYSVALAAPVTLEDPAAQSVPAPNGSAVPGFALATVFVAAGLVAVAVALVRRP